MASLLPVSHGADAAGGEEIFSSDGLDALPKPPPPLVSPAAADVVESSLVDTDNISASQAFEVFAGKLYPVPSAQQQRNNHHKMDFQETALGRLARLQAEVTELQQDLKDNDSEGVSLAEIQQVQASLEQTRLLLPQRQQNLTAKIEASMPEAIDSTATTTIAPSNSGLEGRLQRLEALVGTDDRTRKALSLTARLVALEAVQPSDWEATQKRAKVIRQDLEAAAKARNKLASMAGSASSQDAKAVTGLYDLQQQLSGCADHLPALVQRLQGLAHLHASQATWSARLKASEDVAIRLQTQVAVAEDAVEKMQTSLLENAQAIQQNMQTLDERIQKLS